MPKKVKKGKRFWSKEDHDFIIEYTGILSNKSLARKFKVSTRSIENQQRSLGVSITGNFLVHDLLTLKQFAENLGISLERVKKFIENNTIKFKKLDSFVAIHQSELDRVESFLQNNIEFSQLYKLINRPYSTVDMMFKKKPFLKDVFKKQKQFGRMYVDKKIALDYKNYLLKHFTMSEIIQDLKIDKYKFLILKRDLKIKPVKDFDKITRYNSVDVNIMKITLDKEYQHIKYILTNYVKKSKVVDELNSFISIDYLLRCKQLKTTKLFKHNFICRNDYNNLKNIILNYTKASKFCKAHKITNDLLKRYCLKLNIEIYSFYGEFNCIKNSDLEILENYIQSKKPKK